MTNKEIDDLIEENRRIVSTWPEWMQRVTINSKTVSTGQFYDSIKEITNGRIS